MATFGGLGTNCIRHGAQSLWHVNYLKNKRDFCRLWTFLQVIIAPADVCGMAIGLQAGLLSSASRILRNGLLPIRPALPYLLFYIPRALRRPCEPDSSRRQ
jgi:hypothetical protein